MRIATLCLFIPVLLCLGPPRDRAQEKPTTATANAREVYQHTGTGLEKQFDELLRAYQAGDRPRLDAAMSSFSLPNPQVWFVEMFGPSQGDKLVNSYAKSFAGFQPQITGIIEHYGKNTDLRLAAHLSKAWDLQDTVATGIDSSTVVPLKNVSIEAYNLWLSPEGHGAAGTAWMESFVYLDGAFRYLGGGASPFWVRPTMVVHTISPEPVLIHVVSPIYPVAARAKEIEGTVRLHVLIGKDGRVSKIEVLSGPKPLQQAAVDAVKQWRYKPPLLAGEPVSIETVTDVVFSLKQ